MAVDVRRLTYCRSTAVVESLGRRAGRSPCRRNDFAAPGVIFFREYGDSVTTETVMPKTVPPVPPDNQSHKGPGSAPSVPLDTTKGHRDDEKNNIREQGEHGNMTQNTSNRRSG